MRPVLDPNSSFFAPLFSDGRPLLTLGSLGLILAGGFGIFLSATGHFLPHDEAFLGMTSQELCEKNACKIVHFMYHDRVSFGGILISLAILYLWLIHFPLREGARWAWWTLAVSIGVGFTSFFSYLSFGYLDTWHGAATLALLPCFGLGLWLSYRTLEPRRGAATVRGLNLLGSIRTRQGFGHRLLLGTSFGLLVGGLTITVVGMTVVFVPEDLKYMETTAEILQSLNPRLIPLIAHDRVGFGTGVLNVGLVLVAISWCARRSRHLWQALMSAGAVGFVSAIGVHPLVGYNNPVHLAPAALGAVGYFVALALIRGATGGGEAPSTVEGK